MGRCRASVRLTIQEVKNASLKLNMVSLLHPRPLTMSWSKDMGTLKESLS